MSYIKRYHIMVIIILVVRSCRPTLLFSILTPLFLPSLSVSLSYFVLAVPIRKCLGKQSCTSSPISYSHSEWYLIFLLCVCNE